MDIEYEYEIKAEDVLRMTGWSLYAGRKVRTKPDRTLVRGHPVYLDGKVVGEKSWGKQAVASREARPGARCI